MNVNVSINIILGLLAAEILIDTDHDRDYNLLQGMTFADSGKGTECRRNS